MGAFVPWCIMIVGLLFHPASTEPGFFWHVTDFHYDPTYWTTQLSCNDVVSKPGLYGDYWCDANWRLVEDTIQNMKAIKPDVDFIIWTGDSVAHISDNDTTVDGNVELLTNISESIKSHFPTGVKFLPSLGNHDFYPHDQADVKQDEFYNRTAQLWKSWIPDAEELHQFQNGGFYTVSLNSKIRLMALNTNFYYTSNLITAAMKDPAGQFAWMEKVLTKSRADGEKVILTAHVTPGVVTPNFVAWMYPMHQERYVAILVNYSDVIVATHYGHDHKDGFKIMQHKDDDSKAVTQFVAPSVTPWRFKIPGLTGDPHNPGVRLIEYDKQTGHHINYEQYFINLTETNKNGASNWTKLYDFRETYNVKDMSVKSLRAIFNNIESSDDGMKLAQVYCNNAMVSRHNQPCTKENRFEIVCGGYLYKQQDAKKCVTKMIGGATKSGVNLILYFIPFIITVAKILSH